MKIFRFKEERLPHVMLVGRTLKGVQDYFLHDVVEIENLEEIVVDEGEFYCVLYNDTPLVNGKMLEELEEECKGLNICYSIGDGFISYGGYNAILKVCEHPLALQIKSYSDVGEASAYLKEFCLNKFWDKNIIIYDPLTTYFDLDVEIEEGAIIHPMVTLRGKTKIGKDAVIFPGTELIDTIVGENVDIRSTYALEAVIGKNTTVGPYACLRKGANVGAYCRVGDFVEVKNSNIADGVKMAHLAYVGDSDVGENTNIGCGSVFANYNGTTKSRCSVGSNVFIGANTNLVAPVEVGNGAYIAAGSTITQHVPSGNLCIARSRQVFKENWEKK